MRILSTNIIVSDWIDFRVGTVRDKIIFECQGSIIYSDTNFKHFFTGFQRSRYLDLRTRQNSLKEGQKLFTRWSISSLSIS